MIRLRWAGLLAALAMFAASCEAWATVDPSLAVGYIFREPAPDAYTFWANGDVVGTRSHPSSGNTRAVFRRVGDPMSTDHQVCATWWGPHHGQQPGLALRVRHDGGTQAIVFSKNIWSAGFSNFNVHLMNSNWHGVYYYWLAGRDLPGLRWGPSFADVKAYPWRGCARAVGATFELKVWPVAEPEPDWGDPNYGFSTAPQLTPEWYLPGYPGTYIGHLGPDATFETSNVTTESL